MKNIFVVVFAFLLPVICEAQSNAQNSTQTKAKLISNTQKQTDIPVPTPNLMRSDIRPVENVSKSQDAPNMPMPQPTPGLERNTEKHANEKVKAK